MSVDWQEELATGIEAIDNQHRTIFARFAVFSAACSAGGAGEELLSLIDFMEVYTAEHFRDEEAAMSGAGFPQLAEQAQAHAAFLDDFVRLKMLVEDNGPSRELILNQKRIMVRWLINHIRHMDRGFADFISTTRQPPHPPTV